MRKIILTVASALLLTACGGSGGSQVACDQAYWDGSVGSCLPEGWRVLNRAALTERGVPPEAVVAFQAEQPVSGQFPTVTVTREQLTQKMTSTAYSEASVRSVATLPGYEETDVQEIKIDGNTVTLHSFTAQPQSNEPKVKFHQVSLANDTTGYTFTAASPLTVTDSVVDQLLLILRQATLTPPPEN